jgi:hypothetical protein
MLTSILIFGMLPAQEKPVHEKKPVPEKMIKKAKGDGDRLGVLWTSGDPEVAKKMVFLYTYNAKKQGWFETVRLIIWGPSTKLLSKDKELQDWIAKMKEQGIELAACKWCADQYGVSAMLEKMGVEVIYYGKPFTKMLKGDWKVLTF